MEAGHLLPLPRTRAALRVLTENVRAAQEVLPVPLAMENIAVLISWPEDELTEAQLLTALVERTGVLLLLDVANLHTAQVNFGLDPIATLEALPLDQVGHVHVAGGSSATGSGTTPTPTRSASRSLTSSPPSLSGPRWQASCWNATTPTRPTLSWLPRSPPSGR